jgi:hypothetical protein
MFKLIEFESALRELMRKGFRVVEGVVTPETASARRRRASGTSGRPPLLVSG